MSISLPQPYRAAYHTTYRAACRMTYREKAMPEQPTVEQLHRQPTVRPTIRPTIHFTRNRADASLTTL